MKCYRVEEQLSDEEAARRMPLPIWIWADEVKCFSGNPPQAHFMTSDKRMIALLHGIFDIRETAEEWAPS